MHLPNCHTFPANHHIYSALHHTLYHHPMIVAVFLHLQHTPRPPQLALNSSSPGYSPTSPCHLAPCHTYVTSPFYDRGCAYTQLIVAWIFTHSTSPSLSLSSPGAPDIYSPTSPHHSAPCHTYVTLPFYDCGRTYTQLRRLDIHLLDLSSIVTWIFSY